MSERVEEAYREFMGKQKKREIRWNERRVARFCEFVPCVGDLKD